jgi:beta-mannanase
MKKFILIFCVVTISLKAQLKFIAEDFEGITTGSFDLKQNGIFTFGAVNALCDSKIYGPHPANNYRDYAGDRALKIETNGKLEYGGWGKGLGLNINLNADEDYFNFYIHTGGPALALRIEIQEDDDNSNTFNKDNDDVWVKTHQIGPSAGWQLISVYLKSFTDGNKGGDGVFNCGYKTGKIFSIIFSFSEPSKLTGKQTFYFDFLSFSKGKLKTGASILDAPNCDNYGCNLGAWSKEGNNANFIDIARSFEANFSAGKKLGVVHFFHPFACDGGNTQNHYPSVERINKVISEGYIPMITLEDHFVNIQPGMKQPNLYSIVEGHFDAFFAEWAKEIKQVNGTVLLRILHEFNGDWYPWCTINNDKNPAILINAYRHIFNVIKRNGVDNVKFIWCPNSMSVPQESWNYIMDAYPGDEYVDYVGLDVYNGAGRIQSLWRSFRKEGIENYFILTELLPDKPLLICETASRERSSSEAGVRQGKADWIKQMSEALSSDMSSVRLLTWFNEKETFKVNSSRESKNAFINYLIKNEFFKPGHKALFYLKQ